MCHIAQSLSIINTSVYLYTCFKLIDQTCQDELCDLCDTHDTGFFENQVEFNGYDLWTGTWKSSRVQSFTNHGKWNLNPSSSH